MGIVTVSKDISGSITVSFHYDPQLFEKVKTIEGRRWHLQEKYWSFPNTEGTVEKILEVFEGEEIHIDPVLPTSMSVMRGTKSRSKYPHNFKDLGRELVSRKYSYSTVKTRGRGSLI